MCCHHTFATIYSRFLRPVTRRCCTSPSPDYIIRALLRFLSSFHRLVALRTNKRPRYFPFCYLSFGFHVSCRYSCPLYKTQKDFISLLHQCDHVLRHPCPSILKKATSSRIVKAMSRVSSNEASLLNLICFVGTSCHTFFPCLSLGLSLQKGVRVWGQEEGRFKDQGVRSPLSTRGSGGTEQ